MGCSCSLSAIARDSQMLVRRMGNGRQKVKPKRENCKTRSNFERFEIYSLRQLRSPLDKVRKRKTNLRQNRVELELHVSVPAIPVKPNQKRLHSNPRILGSAKDREGKYAAKLMRHASESKLPRRPPTSAGKRRLTEGLQNKAQNGGNQVEKLAKLK